MVKASNAFTPETLQSMESTKSNWTLWGLVCALVLILDQASKIWISDRLDFGQSWWVNDWLNIVRVHNPGAAFSFLADAGGWQRWFFTILGLLAMSWIVWMIHTNLSRRLLCLAMALLLGGAAGNVVDRIRLGEVVDFIQIHGSWLAFAFPGGYFPSFNVADSAISLGVVLMLLEEWLFARQNKRATRTD